MKDNHTKFTLLRTTRLVALLEKLKNTDKRLWIAIFSILLLLAAMYISPSKKPTTFNAYRAYQDIAIQLSFGPRIPGSDAHANQLDWMESELVSNNWQVERQHAEMLGHSIVNLLAKRGRGNYIILLGAHYDSRLMADKDTDPAKQSLPVPGANDGASGVAVLMELARVLPRYLDTQIWLVFFDAEDNGGIEGWNWTLGSQAFADNLSQLPDEVIIVDMVGDLNLSLPIEGNSNQELAMQVWDLAKALGYADIFSQEVKFYILDDHLPFRELGIPAIDIIDIEYPYWHTSEDTLLNVSAASLDAVGTTLLNWILNK